MLKRLVNEVNADPFKLYTLYLLNCAVGALTALGLGLYLYHVGMVALWVPTIILLVATVGMICATAYAWHAYERKFQSDPSTTESKQK